LYYYYYYYYYYFSLSAIFPGEPGSAICVGFSSSVKVRIMKKQTDMYYMFPGRSGLSLPNCISINSAVFTQLTAESLYFTLCVKM